MLSFLSSDFKINRTPSKPKGRTITKFTRSAMDTHVPTCINAVEKLSKNEKSIAKNVPIIVIAMPMQIRCNISKIKSLMQYI